jgi:uncharacterized protein YegL
VKGKVNVMKYKQTDLVLRKAQLADNSAIRVPVCLVLDCSPSMSGELQYGSVTEQLNPRPIDALNRGLAEFYQAINSDEIARYAADVAIVAFSGCVEVVQDFQAIGDQVAPRVELETEHGGTSLGTGVNRGLELLQLRKREFKEVGTSYWQPWLFIMTDGLPTDDTHIEAARRCSELVNKRKLTVFSIGVGHGVDMNVLALFSSDRAPVRLQGLRFSELFRWISQSVVSMSQSTPGERIQTDLSLLAKWAVID